MSVDAPAGGPPEDGYGDDALMAEYVVGVLPVAEVAAVEARLPQEPALLALHAWWHAALQPMLAAPEIIPP
ncbi:MAG: hypothetical protein WBA25_10430, partial [Jannaschia sp.]